MGPLQKNLTPAEGARLICYGYERGINFIDTAELYETYGHIKEALKAISREKYVIASKCYAYSEETARISLEKALREIDTDYIDIFMLHEQMNELTIKGHYEAVEYFMKMKQRGVIRAFGISTHHVEAVRAALKFPEIEVIHPITNKNGLGIQDGTMEDMEIALRSFKNRNGGVYGMKPLGGGNLLSSIDECFEYILNLKALDSVAFGMQSEKEIDYNVLRVMGKPIPNDLKIEVSRNSKSLYIADWCVMCGACVEKCNHSALKIGLNVVEIHRERCVLCGYCSAVCPEFCIKVY